MQRKHIRWILILTLMILSACQFPSTSTEKLSEISTEKLSELALLWQEDIDQISKLYDSQSIPEHLLVAGPVLQGDEFDVRTALEVLDHLSMAAGYQLAYVYKYDPMGSYPVLYAHLEENIPFTSLKEYLSARPECFQSSEKPSHCSFMQLIETDCSEIGYLQFILFQDMGRQFYLDWHANYNDRTLIATEKALDQIINQLSDTEFGLSIDDQQKDRIKNLVHPAPEVTIGTEFVTLRVVFFTKWGGFYEAQYELNKDFPHTIQDSKFRNLFAYDCGIMF